MKLSGKKQKEAIESVTESVNTENNKFPKLKLCCPNCHEDTYYEDNLQKMAEYIREGIPEDQWNISISTIPSNSSSNQSKPGGISHIIPSIQFEKGSRILKKLKLGRVCLVTMNTYICYTCGTTWVTEDREDI